MWIGSSLLAAVSAGLVIAACGAPARQPTPAGQDGAPRDRPNTLTVAMGAEVDTLGARLSGTVFGGDYDMMLNSPLVVLDPTGGPHPRLAAALPSRDDGTWVVNADGTMRTTWKIRPDAKWHDGRPIAASDFVFAHQLYLDPAFPLERRQPEEFMDRIEVLDDNTFIIHWNRTFPWANRLIEGQLQPLPEHVIGSLYRTESMEAFHAAPFWTTADYVGSGPYRLAGWDPGTQLIFEAFDQYFLGRPRIDRVIFRIIPDPNTVVANLLSGEVDASINITLGAQAAATVRESWASNDGGTVINQFNRFRYLQIQFNPEYLTQPALLDVRVRRAIVHGVDRATLAEIVTAGSGRATDVFLSANDRYYAEAARAAPSLPYDPNRATALLREAGWSKSGDRLVNARGEPFTMDIRGTEGTDNETEQSIIAADLRKLGIELSQSVIARSLIRDREFRVKFPGLNQTAFGIEIPETLRFGLSSQCPDPRTRFSGGNRGCWTNPEFDRLYQTAFTSLDENERYRAIIGALKLANEDVGIIPLFHYGDVVAFRKGLTGPGSHWPAQEGDTWNIHEWRLPKGGDK